MSGFQAEASKQGLERIIGGIIICALRSMPKEHGIRMAELAAKYLEVKIVKNLKAIHEPYRTCYEHCVY